MKLLKLSSFSLAFVLAATGSASIADSRNAPRDRLPARIMQTVMVTAKPEAHPRGWSGLTRAIVRTSHRQHLMVQTILMGQTVAHRALIRAMNIKR